MTRRNLCDWDYVETREIKVGSHLSVLEIIEFCILTAPNKKGE